MATELTIPHLGHTLRVAKIVRWDKSVGDWTEKGETVLEIETDKVTYGIEAPTSGFIKAILATVGAEVPVGAVVAVIGGAEERVDAASHQIFEREELPPAEAEPSRTEEPSLAPAGEGGAVRSGRPKASPLARAMAKRHGLDLSLVKGTGLGGRIRRADVLRAMETDIGAAPAEVPEKFPVLTPTEEIPIEGARKVIFEKMHLSLSSQAQVTLQTEASAHGMIELRRIYNEMLAGREITVSFNAILVKAIAQALRQHPNVNASVVDGVIRIWKEVHVGVAMEVEGGLIVPKVRNADAKSIKTISEDLGMMVEKARRKALLPDDLQGGTFTLTNLGAWGVDHFTPIVNDPESAVLGVGRIVDKPWAVDGQVVVEPRIALSLTFDHRIIDGALAAAFLKTLTEMLEEPRLML